MNPTPKSKTRKMKTRFSLLNRLVILVCTFLTTAVFGQSSYVWTNQNPAQLASGDLNQGTNWMRNGPAGLNTDAGGVPRPDFQDGVTWGDEMLFNGLTTGPVVATQNGGSQANGAGSGQPYGLRLRLGPNQTSPVTIYSAVPVSGGFRMNYFTVDAGAGALNIGGNLATNIFDIIGGVLNGQISGFTNNSSMPCVVNPDVRWRMGGAGAHAHVFTGTGDWIVKNYMRAQNGATILVQKFGPGTMTWYGTNVGLQADHWKDAVGSPIIIGEGTMIWKTSDLVSAINAGNPNIVHNGTLWKYDVQPTPGFATGPGQVLGNISGAGTFEMAAGTLTFGGGNTFSGNINLTGGMLIAGSTEIVGISGPLGQGGIISFNGGTLGWNLANAFDYSSRFSTANNQAYSFDTGGSSPTLATGLSSSGGSLSKLGGGTLTLAGNSTYTGPTTVTGGALVFQGTKSGNANITVADGATLGVVQNGSQITPDTLTLGASTGIILEFNNVTNKTTATLAANNLSAGPVTINVNSGQFLLIGDTFPLLRWTNGSAPAVTLGLLAGAGGHLTTNGNQIDLVIDNPPYIWTGANSLIWDTATVNWVRNASPVAWVNGNYALLDDSAGANTNLALSGSITPTNASIANSSGSVYAITNSPGNVISGPGSLTKSGSGTLILPGGANNYTGATTLGGGILGVDVLANGGSPSDIGAASSAAGNLVFNGGTLQYTGPGVSTDRLFSVGPGGGTIENVGAGALAFTNTGSLGMIGNGPRALTLTGLGTAGDTLACNLTNHPAGTSLRKTGAGLWILTGTNTHAGGISLLEGSLQIGTGGTSGTLGNGNIATAAGTAIDFQRAGTLTVPGAINGNASVSINGSGTVILANNNGYNGGTTINTGTLQVGSGGGSGSLLSTAPIVNNSLLVFNTAGSFLYGSGANGIISGSGNVIFQGGGTIKAVGNNSYTGWTRIDANTTFFCREGQDGALVSSVVTNNGTLRIVEQNIPGFTYSGPIVGTGRVQIGCNNVSVGQVILTGTNSYTGNTFIGGNELILGDNANAGYGTIVGNVQFVNNFTIGQDNPRTLTFNRPAGDDFTFSGTITTNFNPAQVNRGIVQLIGGATVTLTANNTYAGGTVITAGTLQVGNGGGSGTLGFGPVTLNSTLIVNRTGNLALGTVTGTGTLIKRASGILTLSGASTAGAVVLEAGTLGAAPVGAIGSLTVAGDLTIVSGSTLLVGLDRSLSPSNSVFSAATITHTNGGILRLINGGPGLLSVGDKFNIFNVPVNNMTIVSPGITLQNDLAVDGSVTVTAVSPLPPITATVTGGTTLNLSWPADWTGGVLLQGQTNSLTVGISNNWVTIPGTDAANTYSTQIRLTNRAVFYRLINP